MDNTLLKCASIRKNFIDTDEAIPGVWISLEFGIFREGKKLQFLIKHGANLHGEFKAFLKVTPHRYDWLFEYIPSEEQKKLMPIPLKDDASKILDQYAELILGLETRMVIAELYSRYDIPFSSNNLGEILNNVINDYAAEIVEASSSRFAPAE